MKKRLLLFAATICIVGGIILMVWFNSDYYYAKRLVHAIRSDDLVSVEHILNKKPSCAGTYPQPFPEKIFNTTVGDRGMDYPLSEACETGNLGIVKKLIEAGADPNCNAGYPPLSITYLRKREDWYPISLYLIDNGASLDYVTESSGGQSAALMDIMNRRPGGADTNYVPESEEEVSAAFHYALEHCDHGKVDWRWVLQESVTNDRIEIVKFLLDENYCDVNDTSFSGMTALMFATRDSTAEMTQLLLDRGADKDYIDSRGKTAYDYAVEKGKDDVASLLVK